MRRERERERGKKFRPTVPSFAIELGRFRIRNQIGGDSTGGKEKERWMDRKKERNEETEKGEERKTTKFNHRFKVGAFESCGAELPQ